MPISGDTVGQQARFISCYNVMLPRHPPGNWTFLRFAETFQKQGLVTLDPLQFSAFSDFLWFLEALVLTWCTLLSNGSHTRGKKYLVKDILSTAMTQSNEAVHCHSPDMPQDHTGIKRNSVSNYQSRNLI